MWRRRAQGRGRKVQVEKTGWVSGDTRGAEETREHPGTAHPEQAWRARTGRIAPIGLAEAIGPRHHFTFERVSRSDQVIVRSDLRGSKRRHAETESRQGPIRR